MPVPGTRGVEPDSRPPTGQKKGRKSSADVQDIISGIVHLLGGKVNLAAASDAQPAPVPHPGTTVIRPQMLVPAQQSTRINNRAPPRLAEVPFEAIPLELGNSAGQSQQQAHPQLPFGVPLRPPLWPPTMPQSGQNIQELPFASGIPLPVQLVPPVSPGLNRPWAPPSTTSTTTDAPAATTAPTPNDEQKVAPPPLSSSTRVSSPVPVTTISFFPEDHAVRHPPAVLVHPTTTAPALETSTLDSSVLQPSIEDVTTSTSVQSSPSSWSNAETTLSTMTLLPATSSAMPHDVESGSTSPLTPPTPFAYPSFTPPLPAGGPRPGQVFHDEYITGHHQHDDMDVITSDNVHPTYGDTFELVVTAAQNFAPASQDGSAAPAVIPGRPYVIPMNIDHVRGGSPVHPSLPASEADDSDQYVSIDGRKTYFNLFPTDVPEGTAEVVQPTALPPPYLPVRFRAGNGHPAAQKDVMVGTVRLMAVLALFVDAQVADNDGGVGYAHPSMPNNAPLRIQQHPSRPTRPPPPPVRSSTPVLIRRPSSTTPIGRIDACIVGDPNACLEPNESCQAEVDGAACSCKPGFGRKKTTDVCKALAGFIVSMRLDRLDSQRLSWSSSYSDPSTADFKQLEWEANQAVCVFLHFIRIPGD